MNRLTASASGISREQRETNHELRKRYEHMRGVAVQLGNQLISSLSKQVLHEGGKKLGIIEGETLVFDSEDEMSLLMDYCIYNVRSAGRNRIEQYLLESPPPAESDEMVCLQAMQKAIYSVFLVEAIEPDLGVHVQNLSSLDRFLLADLGLAATGEPGLVLASRVLFFPEFGMTGGAALPLGVLAKERRRALLKRLSQAGAIAGGWADPAPVIRECRRRGAVARVAYRDLDDQSPATSHIEHSAAVPAKIGRNDPCPCGSGKKFKHCCLKTA